MRTGWPRRQRALAREATPWGQRFTALAQSVRYRGGAVAVAGKILPATAKHAGKGAWLDLLRQCRPALPGRWTVIGLSDRGRYAGGP